MLKKLILLFSIFSFSSISFSAQSIKKYDVVSIGKAMVDIISYVSEEELAKIMPKGFKKADTTKVNDATADQIFAKMKDIIIIPGGSEANIIADVASLGGNTAFNAALSDDKFGKLFIDGFTKERVDFLSPFAKIPGKYTARCFTFITPDKDRTFAVSIGVADDVDDSYINYNAIKDSKVFFTDASNLDNGGEKSEMIIKAFDLSRKNSGTIAFNINNNHYVEKHRDEIISLLPKIDIFTGSEKEAMNIFKDKDIETTITKLLKSTKIVIITQGRRGATIATKDARIRVPSVVEQSKIVDLNGAGDAFVAGFLYGYTHGFTIEKSGEIAAKTAAELIYQVGARPKNSLRAAVLQNPSSSAKQR